MRLHLKDKIAEANLRRKELEDLKMDKKNFDLIKWDLYRAKCEYIDEEHAKFKHRQLKIFWWLQLIL